MKRSIPSDVWETKKAVIARLYKDEEWPLKQVTKQIRSADFNPRYVSVASGEETPDSQPVKRNCGAN